MATTLEGQPLDENTKHFLQEAHASHYDFHSISVKAAGDERLKRAVSLATLKQATGRENRLTELPDSDKMRTLAGEIKQHTLDHLDYYLEQFKAAVERDGGHVHLASTGADAKRIIMDLVREKKLKLCVKAKSMVSEEIELTHALENL